MCTLKFWLHTGGHLLEHKPLTLYLNRLACMKMKPHSLTSVSSVPVIPATQSN